MRKLIWSGTALVLLMTMGMYFAAHYAAQNPDSFLGRSARTLAGMTSSQHTTCCTVKPTECEPAVEVAAAPAIEAVVEPIVVLPDLLEPSALPTLPPEIAAAIDRILQDEESEAPRQAFDAPRTRMPYADEEVVEVLPMPTRCTRTGCMPTECPSFGMFFLPTSCWQLICDQLSARFRALGGDEPAEDGAREDETHSLPADHYHLHGCPYLGRCPYPSPIRPNMPVETRPVEPNR